MLQPMSENQSGSSKWLAVEQSVKKKKSWKIIRGEKNIFIYIFFREKKKKQHQFYREKDYQAFAHRLNRRTKRQQSTRLPCAHHYLPGPCTLTVFILEEMESCDVKKKHEKKEGNNNNNRSRADLMEGMKWRKEKKRQKKSSRTFKCCAIRRQLNG